MHSRGDRWRRWRRNGTDRTHGTYVPLRQTCRACRNPAMKKAPPRSTAEQGAWPQGHSHRSHRSHRSHPTRAIIQPGPPGQKKSAPPCVCKAGRGKMIPGGALLSHGRTPQYPRRRGPSLPCSEWERVLPPLHGHREKPVPTVVGKENIVLGEPQRIRASSDVVVNTIKPHGLLVPVD